MSKAIYNKFVKSKQEFDAYSTELSDTVLRIIKRVMEYYKENGSWGEKKTAQIFSLDNNANFPGFYEEFWDNGQGTFCARGECYQGCGEYETFDVRFPIEWLDLPDYEIIHILQQKEEAEREEMRLAALDRRAKRDAKKLEREAKKEAAERAEFERLKEKYANT